ncbi:glutamine-dependent NAD(+) synthetase [Bachmanniomyces sp. S44760]|nr:glutamine-dependent NAD(+) synthetase [Bachmanniomyces sp. S44760]
MQHLVTLATCSLNQWAMDFEGNTNRIIESIVQAKAAGASLRVGPELEITGYGCLDHFLEGDTFLHSFEMLARIIDDDRCQDILLDIGMPVRHKNVRYNCRVLVFNRKVLLIRPKMWLANDGNFFELRYFTPWMKPREVEDYYLETIIGQITGQDKVPFGDAVISTKDTCLGTESCEELFTPAAPHVFMGLEGVEIFTNSSGSHHELRKLDTRMNLILEATRKSGGCYLYANQQGCDGDRLYYDGSSMIIVNGDVVAQGSQFSLNDVEVVTATIDLEDIRTYRCSPSRGLQAQQTPRYKRLEVDCRLSKQATNVDPLLAPSWAITIKYHKPEEEIALGPACWLWDYLRRCGGAAGFFIPLSGGLDSASTATIVYSMCCLVTEAMRNANEQVIKDAKRIVGEPEDSEWQPADAKELCGRLFHTCFMGSKNSSKETRKRAGELSRDIGAYHIDIDIDMVTTAIVNVFSIWSKWTPRFQSNGGSAMESISLQNIQARSRMVMAYLFAQLLPTFRGHAKGGSLLVLGSANVDEALRGYFTKYDCSSADINPIGGISKTDLKRFLKYAQGNLKLPILKDFLNAMPTAELEPITSTYVQSDEADMGFTYDELSVFGYLRKVNKLGPWGTYTKLLHLWSGQYSPREIYTKTRRFFYYYAINRHKMTILTPSYHAEQYSPDDNRYDLRPFLYPSFSWPYKKIEEHVASSEAQH